MKKIVILSLVAAVVGLTSFGFAGSASAAGCGCGGAGKCQTTCGQQLKAQPKGNAAAKGCGCQNKGAKKTSKVFSAKTGSQLAQR